MSRSLVPAEVLTAMLETCRRAPIADIVEVGVYQGGSAFELAKIAADKHVTLHLFDTFAGMPFADAEDKHQPGEFADTSLDAVKRLIPDAWCYPGVFPDTLPVKFKPLSFVHADVDQYRSTTDVIAHLWPLLVPGGVIWFDDCELQSARQAIADFEKFSRVLLRQAPQGRLYGVKS